MKALVIIPITLIPITLIKLSILLVKITYFFVVNFVKGTTI